MDRVFISHSTADRVLAHAVAEKLKSWGFGVFVDFDHRDGIAGGAAWESEILSGIRESIAVILCFTESVTDSLWCFGETLIARYERKPIIPLLLHGSPDAIWGMLRNTVQYIDISTDPDEGYRRLRSSLERLAPPQTIPETFSQHPQSPWVGLTPLTERQASLYFGRDKDLQAALARLRLKPGQKLPRILTVTGSSGSGKSSLLAAGLIPSLKRGAVAGSEDWTYVSLVPGEDPIRRLAESLRRAHPGLGGTRQIAETLREDELGLSYILSDIFADSETPTVCITVDQFDELVSLAEEETASLFIRCLYGAIGALGPDRIVLIMTIRIDQLSQILSRFDSYGELFVKPFLLSRLTRDDLTTVITGPAQTMGWIIDPNLVTELVADASGTSDPLPLLSFVLRLMVEAAEDVRQLTLRDYEHTGGLASALARHAEEAFAEIPASDQSTVLGLIINHLVIISSDGTVSKRPALRSQFPDTAAPAIESLIGQRLLVAGVDGLGAATIDIAHEAVLRNWPRLREAIELTDADVRYSRRLLQGARDTWRMRKRLPDDAEANLILETLHRLDPDLDEIEVLLRWSLTSGRSVTWARDLLEGEPRVHTVIQRIIEDDPSLAQYGILTSTDLERIIPADGLPAIAEDLAQSPIEAIRRASWRITGPISGSALSLLHVPAGDYLIGTANFPALIHLAEFAISRYLVTNLEFAQYVDATGAVPPQHWNISTHDSAVDAVRRIADFPVVFVNYFDALKYCEFRSDETRQVRLPTETEWEVSFSLRSDFTQRLTTYIWGDNFDPQRCNTLESGIGRVTPVGMYTSAGGDSETGIADLCGNVWEWTCSRGRGIDGAEIEYPPTEEHYDAADASVWAPRVQRGGTFIAEAGYATRSFRLINLPDLPLQDFGFRIVVTDRAKVE